MCSNFRNAGSSIIKLLQFYFFSNFIPMIRYRQTIAITNCYERYIHFNLLLLPIGKNLLIIFDIWSEIKLDMHIHQIRIGLVPPNSLSDHYIRTNVQQILHTHRIQTFSSAKITFSLRKGHYTIHIQSDNIKTHLYFMCVCIYISYYGKALNLCNDCRILALGTIS